MEARDMTRFSKQHWTFASIISIAFVAVAFTFAGCEPGTGLDIALTETPAGTPVSTRETTVRSQALPARTNQTILIASFNIQTFGESKMRDPVVMGRIVEILRQFDIVAIQEVRAKDQTLLHRLMQLVNAQGARYEYLLGPRLGRTVSKEQYAYVYDTNRVITSPDASYTIQDEPDLLHREPLVARFVTRVSANTRPFSFSLVNMHTDPDEVKDEMPVMHTVLKSIREFEYVYAQEDDVLLMGDLNASPRQFGPLAQVPGLYWIIDKEPTNTIRKSVYDNIIFDRGLTNEYTGRSGVLDMCEMFNCKTEEALKISDHLPIWAEFVTAEQMPGGSAQFFGQAGAGSVR